MSGDMLIPLLLVSVHGKKVSLPTDTHGEDINWK